MAATLTILSSDDHYIAHDSGSGVGFFGAGGFGYSIQVGSWASRTYITDQNGTVEGTEIDNDKWVNPSGFTWGVEGSQHPLLALPNDKSTIKIRFENDSAVLTQNAEIRAYDGVSIDNAPSGVEIRGAQVIHPYTTYVANGSGDSHWVAMSGSAGIVTLADSPGSGGFVAATGGTVTSTVHEWHFATSSSPSSVGAKTGKYYISLEYL